MSAPTLHRWLAKPEFQAAYRAARRQVVEAAIGRLQQATTEAVTALQRNLSCGTSAVELSAARVILDQAVKAIELMDLSERVDALEGVVAGHSTAPRSVGRAKGAGTMRSLRSRVERLERSERVSPSPKEHSHAQLLLMVDLEEQGLTEEEMMKQVGPPSRPIVPLNNLRYRRRRALAHRRSASRFSMACRGPIPQAAPVAVVVISAPDGVGLASLLGLTAETFTSHPKPYAPRLRTPCRQSAAHLHSPPMDRETQGAFAGVTKRLDKLNKGQSQLAEGQARHDIAFSAVNSRLDSIEAVLVKLAEGQVKHDVAITKLEAVATRTAGLLNTLAEEVRQLAHAQGRTEASVQQLGERMDTSITRLVQRMDGYAQDVVRGFTKRDEQHETIDARVTALEHK